LFFSGDGVLAMNRCYGLDAARAELGNAGADALAASMAQQDEPAANAAPHTEGLSIDIPNVLIVDEVRRHRLPAFAAT
jgi:hypothetical protein